MKTIRAMLVLLGILTFGVVPGWAQADCPSGASKALGFIATSPAGTSLSPICIDGVTGQFVFQPNSLRFEGATENGFELTLSVTDPTADATVTLPDATQTVGTVFTQFVQGGTAADALDTIFFIAPRAVTITQIDAVWGVAESTGSMDIQVERLQGTEACTGGNGDDLLSAVIDATTTADTVANGALTATSADLDLAAGDRLCLNLTATPNEVVNMVVTVSMIPN